MRKSLGGDEYVEASRDCGDAIEDGSIKREGTRGPTRRRTHSLSDTTCTPTETLCPPLDADLVAICAGPLLLPNVDVAGLEHPAFLCIEPTLDLGETAELDGVEEFLCVVDGADVNVL